ncbi:hypothetical protein KVR01_003270 [Diaporthe batatas]|uniref:uncharacterized protein n=1 Tax=Diaporthe batatas TaxID=748121 RepID=UPI001D05A4F7|nr:uncharacterized protein KVR01_003270 [Diaporthe batatas]KAG8167581.1 hypothetical protein KVR01_003270 [Diaporthe batatas]
MLFMFAVLVTVTSAVASLLARLSLEVPACPRVGTVSYNTSSPDQGLFPWTRVDLCYDDSSIKFNFTAFDEKDFYYNQSLTTNGEIYNYKVMEAFLVPLWIQQPSDLPLEVTPNNVTFQAFNGITATTTLDHADELWVSNVQIPHGLFNLDAGEAGGTEWRMNFFRTVTGPTTFPAQTFGSWSPPDQVNFHITPFFGHATFV